MARFQVWAPKSKSVELKIDHHRRPMIPQGRGGWAVDVAHSEDRCDYAFVVDGGKPLPDPRSPWQPTGVHGPSRTVNHDSFTWSDASWQPPPWESAVIYELHVGTFTPEGTFASAIGRLGHLVQLGVTYVELMPVNEFSGSRGWGYDGVDLFAPHHAYGGPDGLKRFVDACHARGLAVLIDVVYNHLGPAGNYLDQFGPYFTDRYTTPWGSAVNLDHAGSDEVRRFLCDNALMWLRDYHADGLRIDAVHAIFDPSAMHFLEQLAREVAELEMQLGRPLLLIAESDLNDPRLIRPREVGGYGLHAQWSDDFHHALHSVLTGERNGYYADFGSLDALAKALKQAYVYDGCYSNYRQRRHGRQPDGLSGHKFLGYLQNHDQVGNRAQGERSSHLMSTGRLKIGAALVLTSPFVPMLFQGEEWGASSPFQYFTDHDDPELAEAVTRGRRGEFAAFGWKPEEVPDPQSPETYARSKLNWDELARSPHADMLAWHRRLIALRREIPELSDGRLDRVEVGFDEAAHWLVMRRGAIGVACNFAADRVTVPFPSGAARTTLLSSVDLVRLQGDELVLEPESVVILGPEGGAGETGAERG